MFGRKKKRIKKEGCFSSSCAEAIQKFMEREDSKMFFYHVCKHHPEQAMLRPCEDYSVTRDEAISAQKNMLKVCACGKFKKVA